MRVIALVAVVGCSFPIVNGPPANHRELPTFACTTSRLAPALDTAWTAWSIVRGVVLLTTPESEYDAGAFSYNAALGITLVSAIAGTAGMYFGFSRTAHCRDATLELAARRNVQLSRR